MSSKPKSAEDVLGLEYDWLASDAQSHVALFTTAGAGYAPDEFLRDTDAHTAAIDSILARPATTSARVAPEYDADVENTWRLVAELGLYAFDCNPNGGPYELVAAPTVPIHVADLPEDAIIVVQRLVLRRVLFVREPTTLSTSELRQ